LPWRGKTGRESNLDGWDRIVLTLLGRHS
jgi:hypothetical protein